MSKVLLAIRTETAEAAVLLISPLSSSIGSRIKGAPDRPFEALRSPQPLEEGPRHPYSHPRVDSVDQITWTAGRQLSATLLSKIDELLGRNKTTWSDLSGIIVYEGPGSFTGLRIGITVANTAAFILNIPIIGASGDEWLEWGSERLDAEGFSSIVMPFYGAEANISKPKA